MKNAHQTRNIDQKGFKNSKPPARDKLDPRGDLEINENPGVVNKKQLRNGVKTEENDPQGTRREK